MDVKKQELELRKQEQEQMDEAQNQQRDMFKQMIKQQQEQQQPRSQCLSLRDPGNEVGTTEANQMHDMQSLLMLQQQQQTTTLMKIIETLVPK